MEIAICTLAASNGTPEILKWGFTEKIFLWHVITSFYLAEKDDPETLKWALSKGCPIHPDPEIRKFSFLENGCRTSAQTFNKALIRKNVTIENLNLLITKLPSEAAAKYSVVSEKIEWVLENGAEKTPKMFIQTVKQESSEKLKFLFRGTRP
jgi:hypothetical protein